jgi:hypothetical protein
VYNVVHLQVNYAAQIQVPYAQSMRNSARPTARALSWIRQDNNEAYPSLNALNQSIGAKFQNAWRSWHCMENGKKKLLHDMRIEGSPGKARALEISAN